ncbi:hypothetical protein ACFGVS_27620 [Mucilaginibacter sp. AW1-7]|uniref:hypothetical protein n=1 Tax=Mucilaginibacter sp. AW1-7 TaxID=3349874 RepID=UPI003F738111
MKSKNLILIVLLVACYVGCKKSEPAIKPVVKDTAKTTKPDTPVVIVKSRDTIIHDLIFGTWGSVSVIDDYPERYFGPEGFYYEDVGVNSYWSYNTATYRWLTNDTLMFGPIKIKILKLTKDSLVNSHNSYIYRYYRKNVPYLSATGLMSTIIGQSEGDFSSAEGKIARENFTYHPGGMTIDNTDNIYFMDDGTHSVRRINATDKKVYTIIGDKQISGIELDDDTMPARTVHLGMNSRSLSIDKNNNLYLLQYKSSFNYCVLYKYSPVDNLLHKICSGVSQGYGGDGGPAITANANFIMFTGDKDGNIYIVNQTSYIGGTRIRKISSSDGKITTIGGNGQLGFSGDGGQATNASISVTALTIDNKNNLIFADEQGHIRKIVLKSGSISTIAGNGSKVYFGDDVDAKNAGFTTIVALVVNSKGDIFTAENSENNHRIRKIDLLTNKVTTVAGNDHPFYMGDGNYLKIRSLSPTNMTLDQQENLIVSDYYNNRIVKISLK